MIMTCPGFPMNVINGNHIRNFSSKRARIVFVFVYLIVVVVTVVVVIFENVLT